MGHTLMHDVYLPFDERQLRRHFMEVKGDPATDPERHLAYYRKSIEKWRALQELETPASNEVKRARQIEKDERFWVVAALMALFHSTDPRTAFSALLDRSQLHAPGPHDTWEHALDGRLHLWFEVVLGSPLAYREHLKSRLDERTPIPYVREAAAKARLRLEGATHVDALLLNEENGVSVLFEAKVLSDCSATVTYDVLRNQLARNLDVMLDRQHDLPAPLCKRDPAVSCFVLLTPELFREHPRSRLYGWLLNDYREHPSAIGEDLPHRTSNWHDVSRRIGWATFEDCRRVEPTACCWLPPSPHQHKYTHTRLKLHVGSIARILRVHLRLARYRFGRATWRSRAG